MSEVEKKNTEEGKNDPIKDNSPANSDCEDDSKANTQGLSKAQKKKARLARKKEEEKNQEVNGVQKVEEKPVDSSEGKPLEKKEEKVEEAKGEENAGKGKKDKKKGKALSGAAKMALKKQQDQKKFDDTQEQKRKEFEDQQERIRKQLQDKKKMEEDEKQRKADERLRVRKQRGKGKLETNPKKQKDLDRIREQFQRQKVDMIEQEKKWQHQKQLKEQGIVEEIKIVEKTEQQIKHDKAKAEKMRRRQEASGLVDDRSLFEVKGGEFRSPVCCILGHVDTGKTTLLDKIRNTNVQEGEAGGITQQIGATFFPQNKLAEEVDKCSSFKKVQVNLPGLMIIDTPGHESFSNLRSRGSSLCDIAILVIDLMHGLENQTLESLELLKKGKTPFVVALNKIDRCYGWQSEKDTSSFLALKRQSPETKNDFNSKLSKIITQLNEKGYNAQLYWKNDDPSEYISLVPTSGITGQGLPDILMTLVEYSTTLKDIKKKIRVKQGRFNCTIMEVKMIEGHGTTIDCILVDGTIKREDQIVLLGFDGPIITKVRALLTPHPMKEMRIKDQYLHHKAISGANGVKISAHNLDSALAGSPLIVASHPDDIQDAVAICMNQYQNVKKKIKLENMGVGVAASTLGSLEALLEYLSKQNIPVAHVSVGPVSKDDVVKAMKATLSEVPEKRKKEYSCLLVFDVKILADAAKYAEDNQIRIFSANIIYHLTDHFNKYVAEVKEERRIKEGKDAVFPVLLKQVATFRKSDPIVLGVDVEYGVLKIGTPICVYKEQEKGEKHLRLGYIDSIEHNHKKIQQARKTTGSVAISLAGDSSIAAGKNFDQNDKLVSVISRRSIDSLKQHYKEKVTKQEWQLIIKLKDYFSVV